MIGLLAVRLVALAQGEFDVGISVHNANARWAIHASGLQNLPAPVFSMSGIVTNGTNLGIGFVAHFIQLLISTPGPQLWIARPVYPLVDRHSSEIRQAQVFVAVLGASSYTLPRSLGRSSCRTGWAPARCFTFLNASRTACAAR